MNVSVTKRKGIRPSLMTKVQAKVLLVKGGKGGKGELQSKRDKSQSGRKATSKGKQKGVGKGSAVKGKGKGTGKGKGKDEGKGKGEGTGGEA